LIKHTSKRGSEGSEVLGHSGGKKGGGETLENISSSMQGGIPRSIFKNPKMGLKSGKP